MPVPSEILAAFCPAGHLRASINMGNALLTNRDAEGNPGGISIDLARELGRRLGVDVELVVFDAAGKSVAAVAGGQADIGFFAIDPIRGAEIAFTAPYVLIEGCYVIREDSPIIRNEQVDVPGIRLVVGEASAYDLFLTREIQHAEIIRVATPANPVEVFVERGYDVAAGVRQMVEADAARIGGLRLLEERFMVIPQAMGVPKSRGPAAAEYLQAFVEEMKQSGFIATAIERHGVTSATIAPTGVARL